MMNINIEQVEKLKELADVSYEDAKQALEQCNGDLLEAVIYLEKQGKVKAGSVGSFDSKSTEEAAQAEAAQGGSERAFELRFADLQQVRESMLDVIKFGTGRAVNPPVPAAGKTGTAEYLDGGAMKKYAWMMAYAPFENPEIAIAIIVEEGDSGGRTAAPVVRDVLMARFGEAGK